MRAKGFFVACAAAWLVACAQPKVATTLYASECQRRVAVTVDDLPTVGVHSAADKKDVTARLVSQLVRAGVPAIGFVNENKLGSKEPTADNIALLKSWVDAGLELGNHTYSHAKFYDTTLEAYEQELLLGEVVTRTLFFPQAGQPRYFRHPYLNTGPDRVTRRRFEQFLSEHGYAVAPVTIDNSEWLYARAYSIARRADDPEQLDRIGGDYVRYMTREFDFYETLSVDLFGRELPQVLLLHANWLNADHLAQLLTSIASRGYCFVSLGDALQDPAYQSVDDYIGERGVSWLQRWWVSRGNELRTEPQVPAWVREFTSSSNE